MIYKSGTDYLENQPDCVAQTESTINMLESNAKNEMPENMALAKKLVAETWGANVGDYIAKHAGKPWMYVPIPQDTITDYMGLERLAKRLAYSNGTHMIQ